MKILFTKTGIEDEVFEKLKTGLSIGFQDFIKVISQDAVKFDVSGKALLFTSRNGVKSFIKNGFAFSGNRIFSVGKKTVQLLENFGQTSENFENANALKIYLAANFNGEILHFCSDIALDISPKKTEIQKIICYKTELLYPKIGEDYEVVCFFSPSGVRSFAKYNSFDTKKIFSIGETTTAEIRNFTEEKVYTSERNSLEDLLGIIDRIFKLNEC